MPALSKESTAKDGAKDDAKPVDEALVNLCNMHATLNMFVSILNYTTRTELLKDLLKGDFAQTSAYMSMWTGVTALLEFCVNPTLGSLSDVRPPHALTLLYGLTIRSLLFRHTGANPS
jgi:hypothetical protein